MRQGYNTESQPQKSSVTVSNNKSGNQPAAPLPKYRKPKPYEVDNSMKGLDATIGMASSILGSIGKKGIPYLVPIASIYPAIRSDIESSIRDSDAYPAYENWDWNDAREAQD